jgi:hypothetical protein
LKEHDASIFRAEEARNQQEAGSKLGLFSDPEDGGDMFLQNVSGLSMDYVVLYPRRYNSS